MKNKVAKLTVLGFSVLAGLIIVGCFTILTVTQPSTVLISQSFSATANVEIQGQTDANPHYAIVGLKVPNDFTIDTVRFTGAYTGKCSFLPANVPDKEPGGQVDYWTDSLEARYPSGADMKWVVYQSDTNYVTIASTVNSLLYVKMKAGATTGTFNIGYFVTDAALDFTDPTYYSASLNNPMTVTSVVPVELTSFTATGTSEGVHLKWETATESNNQRFEIERSSDNQNFVVMGSVNGKGNSTEKTRYSFTDKGLNAGKYFYRLKQVDFDGSITLSQVIEVEYSVPQNFVLSQNYPNPFNPGTMISFGLPVESDVTLAIYNASGELIKTVAQGRLQAGTHSVNFDASDLSSGIYLYNLSAKGSNGVQVSKTAKMSLLK